MVPREGAVGEVLDSSLREIRNGLLEGRGGPFGYEAIQWVAETPPEAAVPESTDGKVDLARVQALQN